MLEQLIAGLRAAGSENDLHRLQVDAELWLTPAETLRLVNLAFSFPPLTQSWLKVVGGLIGRPAEGAGRFQRRRLDPSVDLYADPDMPRRDKLLIIAYSTVVGRLFFPVSVVLAQLPGAAVDMAVIRDPHRHYFLCGLGSAGDDFIAMLRWLEANLALSDYRAVVPLGMSMGGLAALRSALALGLERGVSIGGRFHWPMRRLLNPQVRHPPAFDLLCNCYAHQRRTRLVCVYPRRQREDVLTVQKLACILPVERIEIDTGEHNLFLPMLRQGEFRPFLWKLLGIGGEAAAPTA